MNTSLNLSRVFIFFCLSCYLYTSKVILSPIYFLFFFCAGILVSSIPFIKKYSLEGNFFFGVTGVAYSGLIYSYATDYGTFANFVMCMILLLSYPFTFQQHCVIYQRFFRFVLNIVFCLYVFECVYRFSNPITSAALLASSDESLFFYKYKYNSLMFVDSNFVALSLISLIAFIDFALPNAKSRRFYLCLGVLLLLLTLSRAAYIALAVYFFLGRANVKVKVIVALMFFVFLSYMLHYILNDGSFISKLQILHDFKIYFDSSDFMVILIGSGIGSSLDVLGVGSHNLFVLIVVEYGFFFLIWFFAFVIFNLFETSMDSLPYWCAIIVCGFSLGCVYPFVFVPPLIISGLRVNCRSR